MYDVVVKKFTFAISSPDEFSFREELGPHLTQCGRRRSLVPTSMPSFILIHPTVWPRSTHQRCRQDRQTTVQDSIRRTVLAYIRSPKNDEERKFRNSIPCTTPQSLAEAHCLSAVQLVSWNLTSLFSTNMAISETSAVQ